MPPVTEAFLQPNGNHAQDHHQDQEVDQDLWMVTRRPGDEELVSRGERGPLKLIPKTGVKADVALGSWVISSFLTAGCLIGSKTVRT